jgi:hypothetical protein
MKTSIDPKLHIEGAVIYIPNALKRSREALKAIEDFRQEKVMSPSYAKRESRPVVFFQRGLGSDMHPVAPLSFSPNCIKTP